MDSFRAGSYTLGLHCDEHLRDHPSSHSSSRSVLDPRVAHHGRAASQRLGCRRQLARLGIVTRFCELAADSARTSHHHGGAHDGHHVSPSVQTHFHAIASHRSTTVAFSSSGKKWTKNAQCSMATLLVNMSPLDHETYVMGTLRASICSTHTVPVAGRNMAASRLSALSAAQWGDGTDNRQHGSPTRPQFRRIVRGGSKRGHIDLLGKFQTGVLKI